MRARREKCCHNAGGSQQPYNYDVCYLTVKKNFKKKKIKIK